MLAIWESGTAVWDWECLLVKVHSDCWWNVGTACEWDGIERRTKREVKEWLWTNKVERKDWWI